VYTVQPHSLVRATGMFAPVSTRSAIYESRVENTLSSAAMPDSMKTGVSAT
jgi:hypothetical protein